MDGTSPAQVDNLLETMEDALEAATKKSAKTAKHAKPVGVAVVSPKNAAQFEKYKDTLRAAMSKPHANDSKLAGLLDDLYRPNAKIGSGSTADAVRHELATGAKVGGRTHSQKASDSIKALQKWLKNNPNASLGDKAAAENVIIDMQNALNGF